MKILVLAMGTGAGLALAALFELFMTTHESVVRGEPRFNFHFGRQTVYARLRWLRKSVGDSPTIFLNTRLK